jgi:glutamyl-tRNA reductase
MNIARIAMPVAQQAALFPGVEPAASRPEPGLATPDQPPASVPAIVDQVADVPRGAAPRRRAAALIRQLGGRIDGALRRELDRFFSARPGLSHSDRAAIARAMARLRNELLHYPRSTLRAAAAGDEPAGNALLLDAVSRLFGLTID